MAYSLELAARVRDVLGGRDGVTERRMFGGLAWMVDGNMACGAFGEDLLVRLGREDAESALREPHAGPMEVGAGRRPMRGFVRVSGEGIVEDGELAQWVDAGAGYAASLPPK